MKYRTPMADLIKCRIKIYKLKLKLLENTARGE
jgi:hypothetical protein